MFLYDFGASTGDRWVISNESDHSGGYCNDTSRVTVTNTGSIEINNEMYRFIELEPVEGSPMALEGVYVERIGGISQGSIGDNKHLFPSGEWCADPEDIS